MAIDVARLEVWDDVEANGGVREVVIPDWIEAVESENLLGQVTLEVFLPRLSIAWDDLDHRKILRMVLTDGSVSEWRIVPIQDSMGKDGALVGRIVGEAIRYDLGSTIIERVEEDGRAHGVFTLLDLSPSDHVGFILGHAEAWFTEGTIDPTDDLDLQYENDSPLSALQELAKLTGTELEIERNGSMDFLVHLRDQIASGAEKAQLRYGKNLQGVVRKSLGEKIVNRVFPVGAMVDAVQATMGKALWEVVGVVGSDVELSGDPIRWDDQLDGTYLEKVSGVKTLVTGTDLAAQEVTVADASSISPGDLIAFRRNSDGDELTYLDHQVSQALYQKVEKVGRRNDIPLIENEAVNPFLADWGGGLPDDYSKIGTPTVAQETSEPFTRFGGSSAHVTASEGEGIESDLVSIAPSDTRRFYSGQMSFFLVSGAVSIKLVDDLGNSFPPEEDDRGRTSKVGQWADRFAIEGIDLQELGSSEVKLQIVAIGGAAEWYLDAIQIENAAVNDQNYLNGRSSNLLWLAGLDFLDLRADPPVEFSIDVVDLQRLHPNIFPFDELVLGGDVQVVQDDLDLDLETRVVQIKRDRKKAGVTAVTLSNRPEDLSGKLGTPGRRPRIDLGKDIGIGLPGVAKFVDSAAAILGNGDLNFLYLLNDPVGKSIKWKHSVVAEVSRADCISTGTTRNSAGDEFVVAAAVAPDFNDEVWLTVVPFSGPSAGGFPGEGFRIRLQAGVSGGQIAPGSIIADKLTDQARSWTTNVVFSALDADTAQWGSGTLQLANGDTFSIVSGNTGNMTVGVLSYVYFDRTASTTVLQVTTTYSDVADDDVILVAVCRASAVAGGGAFFVPGVGALGVNEVNLLANSVATVNLQALSVTAAKISVVSLSAVSADMGILVAGKIAVGNIEINAATERILMGAASAPLTGIGVFLGKDGADYEFRVGDPGGDFIHWDGSVFTFPGQIVNPPVVNEADLSVDDEGSGNDDVYTVDWTLIGAWNDTDHLVRATYFREGVQKGEVSGITPSDLQDIFTDVGAGTGSANQHHAIVELYNVSGGATVSSFTTREVESSF